VASSVRRFARDYPDGRIVTLVQPALVAGLVAETRRPARRPPAFVKIWRSRRVSLALSRSNPAGVLMTTYEQLVGDTEATMRRIAGFLGIEFLPTLTRPTFLGRELRPNSSFAVKQYGVSTHGLDRSSQLDDAERRIIDEQAMPLYEEIAAAVAAATP
jgi:hypothetical protein